MRRFVSMPKKLYLVADKIIMKCLKGALKLGLKFPIVVNKRKTCLISYSDVDRCGDKMDRMSISGYIFLYNDASISWYTKKQPIIALSSCEDEYIAGSFSSCQSIWLD